MDNEANRLRTFSEWSPRNAADVVTLARAGFFCTGQGLEVQCWRCGGRISEWSHMDEGALSVLHRRLDPHCPLVSGRDAPAPRGSEPCWEGAGGGGGAAVDMSNDDTIYKIDVLRLISFTEWPVDFISRESLAAAGFYYKRGGEGQGHDRVRCAWCGGELMNWTRGDNPLAEHLKNFPNCQYATAKQRAYQSESISTSRNQRAAASLPGTVDSNESLLEQGVEGVVLGVSGAAELSMASLQAREKSFESHWPPQLRQKPKDLAAAGFYFVGPEDQVRCFQCGGGLKAWLADDDPWLEHTKWFPSCSYLALMGDRRQWVNVCMSQPPALQALACGLQEHCVRQAIAKRLHCEGTPFLTPEALIDAALNEQTSQEPFPSPEAEPLRPSGASPLPAVYVDPPAREDGIEKQPVHEGAPTATGDPKQEGEEEAEAGGKERLEEENRRLKEARLCKVCMDTEVGIVFLPCGHLVSCVQCAPCLTSCPLCRAPVKGVVRTYLS